MTWARFKEAVEAAGVRDYDKLSGLSMQCCGDQSGEHVYVVHTTTAYTDRSKWTDTNEFDITFYHE